MDQDGSKYPTAALDANQAPADARDAAHLDGDGHLDGVASNKDPTDARCVCSSCSGWLTRLIILQLLRMILIISMDNVRQTVN